MNPTDTATPPTRPPGESSLRIEVRDSLADVDPADWDALNRGGYPFLYHAFLHGLDETGCLGRSTGWYPRYVLLRRGAFEDDGEDGDEGGDVRADVPGSELVGAVAAYVKTNSRGEFVFDWAWADAYERHGLRYYPKLVVAMPFTPATGPRLLVREDMPFETTARLLAGAVRQYAASEEYSSVHWLFPTEAEHALLTAGDDADVAGLPPAGDHLARLDCQYHWHNHGYASYDDFLAGCTSKRRKTLRRERRHVTDAGLVLTRRAGDSLTDAEWADVHALYSSTFDRKWGNASLTKAFFKRIGRTLGERTLVVLVHDPNDAAPERPVACSIMFEGDDVLYGRYWGCRREYPSLHFEACYYQGIDHCIERGLATFEPGAQGEHKITRGFEPTLTRSAHWIAHTAVPRCRGGLSRRGTPARGSPMQRAFRFATFQVEGVDVVSPCPSRSWPPTTSRRPSRTSRTRCRSRTGCSWRAGTSPRTGSSTPTGAASSRGSRPASPSCGGPRTRAASSGRRA